MLSGLARVALLVSLLSAFPQPVEAQSAAPSASELKAAVAGLRSYSEARNAGQDQVEPRSVLARELSKLRGLSDAAAALRWASDLGRAWELAQDKPKLEGRPGKVVEVESREGGFAKTGLHFAYRLPRDYAPSEAGYALVLTIPDEGEDPAEHIRTHWTLSELSDAAIVVCPRIAGDASRSIPTASTWSAAARACPRRWPGGISRHCALA